MDAVELLMLIERDKMAHLSKFAQHEKNDEMEKANLHSLAFDVLDNVTSSFSNSCPEAAELVDHVNTLVIKQSAQEILGDPRDSDDPEIVNIMEELKAKLEDEWIEA